METSTCQSGAACGEKEKPKSGEKISSKVDFVAGGLVSAMSKALVYPMETKVLLLALGENAANDPLRLWHGVTMKAIENFFYNGSIWFFKERIRPPPPDPNQPDKRPPAPFLAAWGVACLCTLLVHPLSNTIVGMQASLKDSTRAPASALTVFTKILKEQGIHGFFSGWQLSLAFRMGSAMTLVVYDLVRVQTAGYLSKDVANFVAGALGRMTEVLMCHPIKTLRARKQHGQQLLTSISPSTIMALWAGVGTMAIADAVKIGIRFGLIERVRIVLQWLLNLRRKGQKKIKVDEEASKGVQMAMGA